MTFQDLQNFGQNLLNQGKQTIQNFGQQVSTLPQQFQATGQLINQGLQSRGVQLPQPTFNLPQPTNPFESRFQEIINTVPQQTISPMQQRFTEILNGPKPSINFTPVQEGVNKYIFQPVQKFEQTKQDQLGAYLQETVKNILNQPLSPALPYGPTLGQGLQLGKNVLLETPSRALASGELSAFGIPTFTPENDLQKFFLGDRPINNVQTNMANAKNTLIGYGLDPETANRLAIAGVGAGTVMDAVPFYGGAKKKVGEEALTVGKGASPKIFSALEDVISRIKTNFPKEQAQEKLRGLLTYSDQLLKQGIPASEVDKLSYTKAMELMKGLNTEKQKVFDQLFNKWIGQRDVAGTTAIQVGSKFRDIPTNVGMQVIDAVENPGMKVTAEVGKWAENLKKEFDSLYSEATRAGIDVNYLKNYVMHIWKNTNDEVDATYQAVTRNLPKERKILTYKAGIEGGLTPLYDHPAQILTHYVGKLEKVKADLQFFNELKDAKIITKNRSLGFIPIEGPGFPKAISKIDGKYVQGQWYAPPEVAQLINRVFSPADSGMVGNIASVGHKISSKVQDVVLGGGVPYTPLNFFTYANIQKELMSGQVTSPIKALVRSMWPGGATKFFEEEVETIKKMKAQNIPLTTNVSINNLVPEGLIHKVFGNGIGDAWNKAINDATFSKFMPQLQINFFKKVEQAALGKGKSAQEAEAIAAEATRNFYGIVNSGLEARRNQLGKDVTGTVLFAPKWREAMVNFWVNNVKAVSPVHLTREGAHLNNPLSLQNRTNTFFILGTILTYAAYDALNQGYTGKHLSENPPGTEDKLLIPQSDGYTMAIPFLPSIATVPRIAAMAAKHTLEGNPPQVMKDLKGLLSMPLAKAAEVATNENYYGQPIYDVQDSMGQKAVDIGSYVLRDINQPHLAALWSKFGPVSDESKRLPDYQIAAKMVEAPFRFYKSDSLNSRWYFNQQEEALKTLTPEEKQVYQWLNAKRESSLQNTMAEASVRLANPSVLAAEQNIQLNTAKATGGPIDPFYLLPQPQQKVVLTISSLPPGPEKSNLQSANINWLKSYWDERSKFFESLQAKNPNMKVAESQAPRASDYVQSQMDNKNWNDPQVKAYLSANTQYKNEQRATLGLPPLTSSSTSWGPRVRKASVTKLKLPAKKKFKTMKVIAVKPIKPLKPLKVKKAPKWRFA